MCRSYNSKREVIDYRQLSPREITILLAFYQPALDQEAFGKLQAKLQGKDGRNVTDLKQLFHPGPDVRLPEREQRLTHPTRAASPLEMS